MGVFAEIDRGDQAQRQCQGHGHCHHQHRAGDQRPDTKVLLRKQWRPLRVGKKFTERDLREKATMRPIVNEGGNGLKNKKKTDYRDVYFYLQ